MIAKRITTRMNIIGIGTDIEEVERFKDKIKDNIFLKLIFTEKEIKYCLEKKDPSQHLAARFAGKEAVIKACSNIGIPLEMSQIEIVKESNDVPIIFIHKEGFDDYSFKISLSHSRSTAVGFVIVLKNAIK